MFKKFRNILLLDTHDPQSHDKTEPVSGLQKSDTSLETKNIIPVEAPLKVDYKAPNDDPEYINQIDKSIMRSFHIPVGPNEITLLRKDLKDNDSDRSSNGASNSSSPTIKKTSLSPSLKSSSSSSSSTGKENLQTFKNCHQQSGDQNCPRPLKKIPEDPNIKTSLQPTNKLRVKSHRLTHEQRNKMINFDYKYVKNKRTLYKQVYHGHPDINNSNNDMKISGNTTQEDPIQISFPTTEVIGHGSFGVVFTTTIRETNESVAIKKVLQDKRFKNRELEIMKQLEHPNIIDLKYFFYEKDDQNEVYLNLILDYMPQSLYQRLRHFVHQKALMPRLEIKFYVYQMFKALNYLHSFAKTCHRDIKPQNLLVNPQNWCLRLCDFGSAKKLSPKEPNVSYICSRYYRAPELIFGATNYTNQIDIWSSGCVMAELLLGQPMFPGESGIDQLVEIIKILGTPTKEEICAMNPNYSEHKFPQIKPIPLHKVFKKEDEFTIDFLTNVLKYDPTERLSPLQCLCSQYFDELRFTDGGTKINDMISELKLLEFDNVTELGYLSEEEIFAVRQKLNPRHAAGKE